MKYKVRRQGENLGEFSLEELTRRRETGEFSGGEYVQLAGALDWQPLDLVIQHGYRTAPSTPPPLATGSLPNPAIIWGSILFGIVVLIVVVFFLARVATQVRPPAYNFNSQPYSNRSHEQPVAAASQPVVWTTNTLTAADANKRKRAFLTREWLAGYEQHGQRNPECDAETMRFLNRWIASEGGNDTPATHAWLGEESDKLAGDPHCTDPLVLTIAGQNNVNLFQARHCYERALAAYPGSQHLAFPQFVAHIGLAAQYDHDSPRIGELYTAALPLFSKCFADGSFTPDDQQEIAEILVNGWGSRFFQTNAADVCTIIHLAGTNYQWLALSLDGEREINEAWAARGSGYANTVTDQGWQGFNTHLEKAREDLTAAWNLQPLWPLAPERMITVSLGNSDVNGMRVWFDRTTMAQIDYNPAWNAFRWGLRPRWYGNEASLLAFGVAAVNTGRYDTDVPRKYLDAIYDVESEMDLSPGRHIFGRDDIWPNLERMYAGYLAAPSQAENHGSWRTAYAVAAYFAGKYDVAREQLEALDWKPVPQNLTGWGTDLSQMPLEVAARTGTLGLKVSAAEFLSESGDYAGAIKKYDELAAAGPDPRTKQYIQLRLTQLGLAQRLKKGEWVDWLPASEGDPDWVFSLGHARRLPDGALEVESGAKGHILFSQTHVGQNFEVRGQCENVRSSNKNFQSGIVMGLPDFGGYNWYGFRIKRHDEEGDVVSFSDGWTRDQIVQASALNDITNTFDFVFQGNRVTATVNGVKIFQQAEPPVEISVPDNSYLVGLGAFSDSADSVVRYRNVQLRELN